MQGWRKGVSSKPTVDKKDDASGTGLVALPPKTFDEEGDKENKLSPSLAPLNFFKTCSSLTSKLLDYFPEDAETLRPTLAMMGFVGGEVEDANAEEMGKYMMTSFYDMFSNHFEKILEKDDTFFDIENNILENMDGKAKWMKLTPEQKEESWKEMILLVQLTNIHKMYELCPSKMMDMVTNMAHKVSKQVQSGEMSLDKLNPMEIGQSMVSSMTEEEIQEIGRTLMKKENLEDMMKMMQTSMKGMQNMGGGFPGMPANFDMNALSAMGLGSMGDLGSLASMMKPSSN
jgi:hypothetical protein